VKRLIFFIIAMSFLASESSAMTDLSGLTRLDGVSVYSDDNEARAVLRFDKKLKLKAEPLFFEKSIQFDIEGAYVTPAKKKFKLSDSLLTSAVAYQLSPSMVRVRLFTSEDSRPFKEHWSRSFNNELMIFVIKKRGLAPAPAPARQSEKTAALKVKEKPVATKTGSGRIKEKPPLQVFKPTDGDKKGEALSASISKLMEREPKRNGFLAFKEPEGPESPSMTAMLIKMVASLSLVLSIVFALAWVAKHYLGRLNAIPGYSSAVRVLTTGSIGGKKQVSVVDIAGQILILGVTDDKITLLSNVREKESIDKIRSLTASAQPTAFSARRRKNLSTQAGWAPQLVKSAIGFIRIGKSKASPRSTRAIFDESDPDTFAGQMASARSRAGENLNTGGALDSSSDVDLINRGDMITQVTNSIRKRNTTLTIA